MKQLLQKSIERNDKVQCADYWQWIKRDENHTCRQQVRRDQKQARGQR
jgi:hypothetical protein